MASFRHLQILSVRFVVCVKNSDNFNKTNLDENDYECLHGRHLLQALHELQIEGHLKNLKSISNGRVTSFILSTDCSDLKNYANLRAKEIEAEWSSKVKIEDLLSLHLGLQKEIGDVESKSAVMRYCNFLGTPSDDKTAVQKLISWPFREFQILVRVISKVKSYETLDSKTNLKRLESKLKAGEAFPIKKVLFRALSKVSSEYFSLHASEVVERKISLEDLTNNFSVVENRQAVVDLVVKITNNPMFVNEYSTSFTDDVLDGFHGAKIGIKTNSKGTALEAYCQAISRKGDPTPRLRLRELKNLDNLSFKCIENSDLLVIYVGENHQSLLSLLEKFKTESKSGAFLIICDSWSLSSELYGNYNCGATSGLFNLKMLLFEWPTSKLTNGYCENVRFGLFSGNPHCDAIKVLNTVSLPFVEVIKQLTPPASRITCISDGSQELNPLHGENFFVSYLCQKKVLEKISKDSIIKEMTIESDTTEVNVASRPNFLKELDVVADGMGENENNSCEETRKSGCDSGVGDHNLDLSGISPHSSSAIKSNSYSQQTDLFPDDSLFEQIVKVEKSAGPKFSSIKEVPQSSPIKYLTQKT